jgi:hypothetical protein
MRTAALKFLTGLLLQRFSYVPGTDAAGTSLDCHDAAVLHRSDLLQVRIPHSAGFIVGVAHIVSEAGPFSTDITFSGHIFFPPIVY